MTELVRGCQLRSADAGITMKTIAPRYELNMEEISIAMVAYINQLQPGSITKENYTRVEITVKNGEASAILTVIR
jgi:hypothetical protein